MSEKQHLVALWLRGERDPGEVDWEAVVPAGLQAETVSVRTFPLAGVEHELIWWITRRLTPAEWEELGDAEAVVLRRIVGAGQFSGMAGPIPTDVEPEP
jgi:hypothetical protein